MTTSPVIDPSALERIERFGGKDMFVQLLEIFGRDVPRRLDDARQAAVIGDATALADAVHSLKSTAGNLGATSLQLLAQEIERQARAGRLVDPNDRLDELDRAFRDAHNALRRIRETAL